MRMTELKPGMKCYLHGKLVVVLKVNQCTPSNEITHSHVIIKTADGEERTAIPSWLISQEAMDAVRSAKDLREQEIQRVQDKLSEFLPSVQTSNWCNTYMSLEINQQDALRILDIKEAKRPAKSKLPCNITDPKECRKASILLAQRARRAIGQGYCGKWMNKDFDPSSPTMKLTNTDAAIDDLLRAFQGKDQQSDSALARMFG